MPMISIERLDVSIHARAEVRTDVVEEYAERMRAGDSFPPVEARQRFGRHPRLWLVDGRHRVEAARLLGRRKIEATVLPVAHRQGAVLVACNANADHGLRRTNADKRRAVELMLKECAGWRETESDRAIADHCRVHHDLVGDVRLAMEAAKSGRVGGGAAPDALAESASEVRRDKNGRRMNVSRIREANRTRGHKVSDEAAAEIRDDPRPPTEVARDHGISVSQASRIKNNLSHPDPDYARRLQVDALTKAWDDASPAARAEFVAWLGEHHAGWLRPGAPGAGPPVATPRRRGGSGLDQPRPQA